MIVSLLFTHSPDDVKLILVDPKMVELMPFSDIPHLLCDVVISPEEAANALRWAVNEMEHRYKALSALGLRHMVDYNRRLP